MHFWNNAKGSLEPFDSQGYSRQLEPGAHWAQIKSSPRFIPAEIFVGWIFCGHAYLRVYTELEPLCWNSRQSVRNQVLQWPFRCSANTNIVLPMPILSMHRLQRLSVQRSKTTQVDIIICEWVFFLSNIYIFKFWHTLADYSERTGGKET